MRIRTPMFALMFLCFCTSFPMAASVLVAAGASFTGGLNGRWSFAYTSGATDLLLESITLDLSPTKLRFDTAAGGFGSGTYKDIGGFGGTDATTGLSGISATGVALDGGTLVAFHFSSFSPGSVFQFSSDVDHPDPTLLGLLNCAGKTGFALIACNATNAARTVTNNANLLAAQTVGSNQMAGASVIFQFGGPYEGNHSLSGVFQPVTLQDIVADIARGKGVGALNSNADIANPEPASVVTFVAGLGLLIGLAGRRRRA